MGIPELTLEDFGQMTNEDKEGYKEMKAMEQFDIQMILDEIDALDIYANFNGVNVIDTDYDSFMIIYRCFEYKDEEEHLPSSE